MIEATVWEHMCPPGVARPLAALVRYIESWSVTEAGGSVRGYLGYIRYCPYCGEKLPDPRGT